MHARNRGGVEPGCNRIGNDTGIGNRMSDRRAWACASPMPAINPELAGPRLLHRITPAHGSSSSTLSEFARPPYPGCEACRGSTRIDWPQIYRHDAVGPPAGEQRAPVHPLRLRRNALAESSALTAESLASADRRSAALQQSVEATDRNWSGAQPDIAARPSNARSAGNGSTIGPESSRVQNV